MERKLYQPTEKQLKLWNTLKPATMPTDEEFKTSWKRAHHNVERGWGMGKRDWVAAHANDHLTETIDYMIGLWQGRIDALQGLDPLPSPNYHTSPYDNGYYHGFHGFESFWKGYDRQAREKLIAQYGNQEA